jgi:mRNA interferase RelE/StbE
MYLIKFDYDAIDFLNSLSENIKSRIYCKIISAKDNPHHYFEKLASREDYKLRVGDYRVIADIDDQSKVIYITHIGHRKNIYRKA